MLGAYKPKPTVMQAIAQGIEEVYLLLSGTKTAADAPLVIGDWYRGNAEFLVELIINDFNSKVNLPRGQAIAPKTSVSAYGSLTSETAVATYYNEINTIALGTIPFERLKIKYYTDVQKEKDDPVRSNIFANLMVASNAVSTIYHEVLHRIQLYHVSNPRIFKPLEYDRSVFQKVFFPYPYNTIEMPTFAINAASFLACITPPKLYVLSDVHGIVESAYSRGLAEAFKSSMLDSFRRGLEAEGTQKQLDNVAIYASRQLNLQVDKLYASAITKNVNYDRYIEAYENLADAKELKKQAVKLQKLFNKNLNRMIQDYEIVNVKVGKYIPSE